MKTSELRKLIRQSYMQLLQQKEEKEADKNQLSQAQLDQMFDDPNIRYTVESSTFICVGKHPKFGDMPIFNQTAKVVRDIQKAGLQEWISVSGSGVKFKNKSFRNVQEMMKNAKQLVKNVRQGRDGISMKQLATKMNKMWQKMVHDAARQSGIDIRIG